MITSDKFEEIKEKYGYWSSWALWAEAVILSKVVPAQT